VLIAILPSDGEVKLGGPMVHFEKSRISWHRASPSSPQIYRCFNTACILSS